MSSASIDSALKLPSGHVGIPLHHTPDSDLSMGVRGIDPPDSDLRLSWGGIDPPDSDLSMGVRDRDPIDPDLRLSWGGTDPPDSDLSNLSPHCGKKLHIYTHTHTLYMV